MSFLAQTTLLEDLAGQARLLTAAGFAAAMLCFGTLFLYGKFATGKKSRRAAVRRATPPAEATAIAPPPVAPAPAPATPAPVALTPDPADIRALLHNPATRRAAFIAAEVLAPPPALRR
ncbi:MAG: hypothetical protein LBV28_02405 [Puniceicoccales bacterium]|nr:hypothetical protein [Puniceicoccales bacterium]